MGKTQPRGFAVVEQKLDVAALWLWRVFSPCTASVAVSPLRTLDNAIVWMTERRHDDVRLKAYNYQCITFCKKEDMGHGIKTTVG